MDDVMKNTIWMTVFIMLAVSPVIFAMFSAPFMAQAPKHMHDITSKLIAGWLTIQVGGVGLALLVSTIKALLK